MRTDFHDFVIDKARVRLDFDKSLRLANLYRDSEFFQEILLVVHKFNRKRCKKKFWKEASSSQDTSLDFLSKKTGISIVDEESIAFAKDSQLQSIGLSAFYECENLTNIDLSNTTKLEAVENYAFAYTKISKFVFPESMNSVGVNSFFEKNFIFLNSFIWYGKFM